MAESGSALPAPRESPQDEQPDPLDLDALRAALRPPQLPLSWPRTVLEAAQRVTDLTAQGRLGEARRMAEQMAAEPADLPERLELLAAHAAALRAGGAEADAQAVLAEMVALMHGAGLHVAARAAMLAWDVRPSAPGAHAGPETAAVPTSSGMTATSATGSGGRRGRRRATALVRPVEDEMDETELVTLAVLRALAAPVPARGAVDLDPELLEQEEGRVLTAVEVLDMVRPELPYDPEAILRIEHARVLLLMGRDADAAEQAREALALLDGGIPDLRRSRIRAHGALAAALRGEDPLDGARHAVRALSMMDEIDDPALRTEIAGDLVLDLMAAQQVQERQGAIASYAAMRLDVLAGSLPADLSRARPLLIVAAQRISAGRPEDALRAAGQVQRLNRHRRDHELMVRTDRLVGQAHRAAGRVDEAITALGSAAQAARWQADDLAATPAQRSRNLRAELELRALILRLALDAGRWEQADAEARMIQRRTEEGWGKPVLATSETWDHAVDAAVGRMLAIGHADGGDDAQYARLREQARELIGQAPSGMQERAVYWRAYLEDRDALVQEARGDAAAALGAARRARELWAEAGEAEHADRMDEEIARLAAQA